MIAFMWLFWWHTVCCWWQSTALIQSNSLVYFMEFLTVVRGKRQYFLLSCIFSPLHWWYWTASSDMPLRNYSFVVTKAHLLSLLCLWSMLQAFANAKWQVILYMQAEIMHLIRCFCTECTLFTLLCCSVENHTSVD